MNAFFKPFILASNSERRQALLRQIHADFELLILPEHLDVEKQQQRHSDESPKDYAIRLSIEKNRATRTYLSTDLPVMTADTIVALGDEILGKPDSIDMARKMLVQLSGKTHDVITAVTISVDNQQIKTCSAITQVSFAHLTTSDIDRYLKTENVFDKAGSYAIQESAALFIERIDGSYSNVVGLPLFETGQLLASLGLLNTRI